MLNSEIFMRKRAPRHKSIAYKLTIFVIGLVILQSLLMTLSMVVGGVLENAEADARQSFYEKVYNRRDYIQREMKNRWTKLDPYVTQIADLLPQNTVMTPDEADAFFVSASEDLIALLRTTMTTGAFIILDNQNTPGEPNAALYFRDYDPALNDAVDNDLYLIAGPYGISEDLSIPMDQQWHYGLDLNETVSDFYTQPFLHATDSIDPERLGYWSKPFRLPEDDSEIVTYSLPLVDDYGNVRGVIGVEIMAGYLNSFLPATDLASQDALGYMIAFEDDSGSVFPMIMNGALQKRMIESDQPLELTEADNLENIFKVENTSSVSTVYACIQEMGLYNYNTPYSGETWYIVGFLNENQLFGFVKRIQKTLWTAFLGSIVIGSVGGYFVSRHFAKPVVALARTIEESPQSGNVQFSETGLYEIDRLAEAIGQANQRLLESAAKVSRIIDLVNAPIGVFEYAKDSQTVFVTEKLARILGIEEHDADLLYRSKSAFIKIINDILTRPEPEEQDVYRLCHAQERWVKITLNHEADRTLGVVVDVSGEMTEKNKMRMDRDYDVLTEIYNRRAFYREARVLLEGGDLDVAALMMFDLDNLKSINDRYGHPFGDRYIKIAADHLSHLAKEKRIVGRQSGDEFLVFIYGRKSRDEVRALTDVFYQKLNRAEIELPDGNKRYMQISGGLAWYIKGDTYERLLDRADTALYEVKQTEKGTLIEFDTKAGQN